MGCSVKIFVSRITRSYRRDDHDPFPQPKGAYRDIVGRLRRRNYADQTQDVGAITGARIRLIRAVGQRVNRVERKSGDTTISSEIQAFDGSSVADRPSAR